VGSLDDVGRVPREEWQVQAKELFRILLREQLGPLLRSEGFRGSGQSWRLEHPSGNAALLHFQQSRWNTADRVEFLINLAVASKIGWDWKLSREPERRPSARPSALYVNDCPLWLRIGAPTSEGRGEGAWWTITTGMRLARLAASVTEALGGWAIPLLRDHLTDAALCRWLEAHDPQLGWPPETWRLLYLSVLLAAQGPGRRLDRVLAQLQDQAAQDRRPPWLAEHVTELRQRAMTAAGGAHNPA
jgi:Domain of unknown function (DUF4304)